MAGARHFPASAGDHLTASDPGNMAFDITGPVISLSIWFKANSFGSNTTLFSKGGGPNSQYNSWFSGSTLKFSQGNGSTEAPLSWGTVSTGVWHHWCVVKRGNNTNQVDMYLDGSKVSGTINFNLMDTTSPLTISSSSFPFNGLIAHAALWDVALTDDEVRALSRGVNPTLIRWANNKGYWPLWGDSTSGEADIGGYSRSIYNVGNMSEAGTVNVGTEGPPVGGIGGSG